jgi:dipeptidyl aminopeptidase/acylaminoacyl peptidase
MSEQLSLIQVGSGCTLTETAARFDDTLGYAGWIEVGRNLCRAGAYLNWWLGDWMLFGVKEYGDRAKAAVDGAAEIGMSVDQLKAAIYVSEHVQETIRITSLSWSHHREVAKLPDEKQQKRWLALAQVNNWSVSELRSEMRKAGAEGQPIAERGSVSFSISAWANDGQRWIRIRENAAPVNLWPEEQRTAIKDQLRPIVEFYNKL